MKRHVLVMSTFFLSCACVQAIEVVFLRLDPAKQELTVKQADGNKTYKIAKNVKVLVIDSNGDILKGELKLLGKAREGKTKIEISTDKESVTEIRLNVARKGKG